MGFGEFLFGKRREQSSIDKIDISEQNTANQEGVPEQQDVFKEALEREKAMVNRTKGRAQLMAVFGFVTTLIGAGPPPAQAQNELGEFVRGATDAWRTYKDNQTRQLEVERRLDEERVRAKQQERDSDNRRDESEHRDDAYTRQTLDRETQETKRRQYEVGGRVSETETHETEESRRHMSDRGLYELGHKTENTGSFGNNRRERSGDTIPIDQMRSGGVPTSPLPGEPREAERGRPSRHELSDTERDAMAERAVKDYEKGSPSPDFRSMPEGEREVYGHAWNNLEKNVGKTGITLQPPRR